MSPSVGTMAVVKVVWWHAVSSRCAMWRGDAVALTMCSLFPAVHPCLSKCFGIYTVGVMVSILQGSSPLPISLGRGVASWVLYACARSLPCQNRRGEEGAESDSISIKSIFDQVNVNVTQFGSVQLLHSQISVLQIFNFVPLFGQRINAMFLVTFNVLTGFAHGIVCR